MLATFQATDICNNIAFNFEHSSFSIQINRRMYTVHTKLTFQTRFIRKSFFIFSVNFIIHLFFLLRTVLKQCVVRYLTNCLCYFMFICFCVFIWSGMFMSTWPSTNVYSVTTNSLCTRFGSLQTHLMYENHNELVSHAHSCFCLQAIKYIRFIKQSGQTIQWLVYKLK